MKIHENITPELKSWIEDQFCFFVATAPTVGTHVSVSPKGLSQSVFSVLGPLSAAYIDYTGSGCETVAHLYDNGRITIMFSSFTKSPKIIRLYCKGTVVEADSPKIDDLLNKMGKTAGAGLRAIILLDVFMVTQSCGFGVPIADKESENGMRERTVLQEMAQKTVKQHGPDALMKYQKIVNAYSLDGLPGLRVARKRKGEIIWISELKYSMKKAASQWQFSLFAFGLGLAWGGNGGVVSQFFYLFFIPFISLMLLGLRK
ncbi:hypothetical protein BJ508DRAFT_373878 [Ascobolus immersus RN42]|uniref:Pyridoxamine phosphate oxidase family protein n=1 Tax=Ascobolus immersus RN42 TaxID=1160509 RepID=A0A3N4ILV0_ASCIM|nr:hypothetical protein BJ508DRAFT_373878 [Ascobolus immersus RN42]